MHKVHGGCTRSIHPVLLDILVLLVLLDILVLLVLLDILVLLVLLDILDWDKTWVPVCASSRGSSAPAMATGWSLPSTRCCLTP
jgi:hypothetical protein